MNPLSNAFCPNAIHPTAAPKDWQRRLDGILEQVQDLRVQMLASGHYPGEELSQALLLLHWARANVPLLGQPDSMPSASH